MSYFRTSYATLQSIASQGRYEDVAGFLVMARHASGLQHAGFEPYKLSGAGVNGIHEKVGVSEEAARGVLQKLEELGLINPTSPETRKAFLHGRWEIHQGELDLDLPHALVDSKPGIESALRRIRRMAIREAYKQDLPNLTENELRMDALMVLLATYRHTSMSKFGGLSPDCVVRKWTVESRTPKLGNVRWGANPSSTSLFTVTYDYVGEALARDMPKDVKKGSFPKMLVSRFWNAWSNLHDAGLLYEAVCLYDTLPQAGKDARLIMTLRVNDYHAGASGKTGDPSLLRTLETTSGSRFAYYTPEVNPREEAEGMWVVLPDQSGEIVGVWRPRFRSSNQDAGAWIEAENERIKLTVDAIETAAEKT